MVQEETASKSVGLAVRTTKLSIRVLVGALRKFLQWHKANKQKKQARRETVTGHKRGKQKVRELIGQNQGVSSIDIGDVGLKEFERTARKYGVDFAVVKDKSQDPPVYTVFFKARDADAITKVVDEYTNRMMEGREKPSLLKALRALKEMVAGIPERIRNREHVR